MTEPSRVMYARVSVHESHMPGKFSQRAADGIPRCEPLITFDEMQLSERPRTPQSTFDRVAPYYDLFNSLLSLGVDRSWRRRVCRELALARGARVLDVATGTGALAIRLAESAEARVIGCDLNRAMLTVARRRHSARVSFLRCDAAQLPFPSQSFDAVTIAFAIDDMPARERCASELLRVLRPGGRVALLELARPEREPLKSLYRAYLRVFGLLRRFRVHGYDHLAQEILSYRGRDAARALLSGAGFVECRSVALSWGLSRLHLARRAS
jgi:demethylmenaquinone methyltransferase/2-methoxy-6-polyprenyl-1,4-benzoquinol methylase